MHTIKATLLAAVLAMTALGGTAAAAPSASQRLDFKVLLIGSHGLEPGVEAWRAELAQQGTPVDVILANEAPDITATTLSSGTTRGRYNAIVFADDLTRSALNPAERAAIETYEKTFGVREIQTFVFPSAEESLTFTGQAGVMSQLAPEGALTAEGRAAFPYLNGPVAFDPNTYGFFASPAAGASVTPLVTATTGETLVASLAWPDGRQAMVSTVAFGANMKHDPQLMRGMLSWATEGVGFGMWRNYFAAHIDDIFLPDDRWDVNANVTHEDDGATLPLIRMTPADVARALDWQNANGLKLDFVFNGAGMDEAVAETGSDPLSNSLLAAKAAFRWINHTYTHLNLDTATQAQIEAEIRQNRQFATRVGLPVRSNELVTGEHSGLANPAMPAALTNVGIRWFGADNSRQPGQYPLGNALSVPRHPSNIYYNVGTFAEQLDEYNYIYFENCTPTAVTTCLTQPATWEQYLASEATIMGRHLVQNDARPHYMHQANLAEDGTFYPIVDRVLADYRRLFNVPLVNPTQAEAGTQLQRQRLWAAALAAGRVTGYRYGPFVVLTNSGTSSILAPVSGAGFSAKYGGVRSQWISIPARSTAIQLLNAG